MTNTYARNRQRRQVANKRLRKKNPDFGKPIFGAKSNACIERLAQRKKRRAEKSAIKTTPQ